MSESCHSWEGYDSLDKLPHTEERLNPKGTPVIKAPPGGERGSLR